MATDIPIPNPLESTSINLSLIILLLLGTFITCFFFWVGTVVARLCRYEGELGPPPEKFKIVPQYLKERYIKSQATAPATGIDTEVDAGHGTGETLVSSDVVTDVDIRRAIAEDRRISKLPFFVQDDCGDRSHFPDVPLADYLSAIEPYPNPRFRETPGNYMTMGLKKLDAENWLTVDRTFKEFHDARLELLGSKRGEVIQVLPEGEEACEELMRTVVPFLVNRYPELYELVDRGRVKKIRNRIAKEEYSLQRPYDCHALEMCARLAMEDFNILRKSEFNGQHYLIASATLFPAGWHLRRRIGKSVIDLHEPVPLWKGKLSKSVEHYFSRLNETSCMERSSFFIQIKPDNLSFGSLRNV